MSAVPLSRTAAARWAALASGLLGLAAVAFLVLFFAVARPWASSSDPAGYGRLNDILSLLQYVALVPVVARLETLLAGDARARRWSTAGLVGCGAYILLDALLLAGTLPFAVQVVPASAAAFVTMGWAVEMSAAGARAGLLSPAVIRMGAAFRILLPAAVAGIVAGYLVSVVFDVGWAWVAGGLPGLVAWAMFPAWALLLGLSPGRPFAEHGPDTSRPSAEPGPGTGRGGAATT